MCPAEFRRRLARDIEDNITTSEAGSPFPRNLTKPSNYCRQMCYKNASNSNKSIPLSMVMRMDNVGNV